MGIACYNYHLLHPLYATVHWVCTFFMDFIASDFFRLFLLLFQLFIWKKAEANPLFSIVSTSINKKTSNSQNAFSKVLLANGATSALRLQQRMPFLQLTREYFATLLVEDSCHYLFFSIIFLYVSPSVLIILPVVLFAILHAASYSLTLLDVSSRNSMRFKKSDKRGVCVSDMINDCFFPRSLCFFGIFFRHSAKIHGGEPV